MSLQVQDGQSTRSKSTNLGIRPPESPWMYNFPPLIHFFWRGGWGLKSDSALIKGLTIDISHNEAKSVAGKIWLLPHVSTSCCCWHLVPKLLQTCPLRRATDGDNRNQWFTATDLASFTRKNYRMRNRLRSLFDSMTCLKRYFFLVN